MDFSYQTNNEFEQGVYFPPLIFDSLDQTLDQDDDKLSPSYFLRKPGDFYKDPCFESSDKMGLLLNLRHHNTLHIQEKHMYKLDDSIQIQNDFMPFKEILNDLDQLQVKKCNGSDEVFIRPEEAAILLQNINTYQSDHSDKKIKIYQLQEEIKHQTDDEELQISQDSSNKLFNSQIQSSNQSIITSQDEHYRQQNLNIVPIGPRFSFEKFKRKHLYLAGNKRLDVVIKTTLRKMRKFYLVQFLETTNYPKMKLQHQASFYIEALEAFVEQSSLNNSENMGKGKYKAFKKQLVFFLGCMFYHKKMKEISPEQDHNMIDQIHKSLYKYSDQNLLKLFEIEIFSSLLVHFQGKTLNNDSNLMDKVVKGYQNFDSGLEFLMKLKTQIEK